MSRIATPISLAGSELGHTRHVCAFFNSEEEEYRVLLPFIKDGFECGDKAVHVVNPGQHHDHLQRLAAVGIDAAAAEPGSGATNTAGRVRRVHHRIARLDSQRRHSLYWYPRQTSSEATLLKIYESATDGRARLTAHTAFDDPTSAPDAPLLHCGCQFSLISLVVP